ncbi:Hypothetical protein A7982_10981 [Minicystis rosea]|nr:Hypothetical protein A7982_10981 [Minicystis rosea]
MGSDRCRALTARQDTDHKPDGARSRRGDAVSPRDLHVARSIGEPINWKPAHRFMAIRRSLRSQ